MPHTGRGMVPDTGELEKSFNKETAKTLGDYVLEGGVKGRRFVDEKYTAPVDTVYQVEGIELLGKGGERPTTAVVGRVLKTGEIYMMNMVNCWYHREYSESAQSQPKRTPDETLEDHYCPD